MTENLVLLGATGSIGTQALDVAEKLHIRVSAMAAGSRVEPFEPLCRKFHPQAVAMMDEAAAKDLRVRLADTDIRVLSGLSGVCELAATPEADTVLNSVTGVAGLQPTLAAIEAGHDVALANKETLVAGGELVTKAVAEKGVKLLPVDSEHSAIFQCLQGKPANGGASRLILTASGGPFFGKTTAELETMKKEDALKHPNWSMGAKITIDSATMMNKGLELIEARWLFDMPADKIDIVVHRESVVHSLIEFADNSVLAQCGVPDMRIPIQYALTYPDRFPSPVKQLSLTEFGKLTFFEPDYDTFPLMNVCRRAITLGGAAPAAVNGANEQAVALFLQDKIGFCDISRLVAATLDRNWGSADSVEAILAADREARQRVLENA
ncbi:MAG: 1-deoxy-D-xylulose-5-phosphate reductoisomerase [Clostridia bacterium]|nr:1-deoxy-D-xylulose-5-phosphate reductoisomerase [Clostridia bacterium]